VSVLVSVTLAAAASYGKQRFRAAAEPVLLVAASVAVVHLLGRRFNGLVALEASEQRPLPHGQDL
jgi:hypothetical protein